MQTLRLAIGLFTIFPVRAPQQITTARAGRAMLLAPVVMLPFTALAALLGWSMVRLGAPSALAGVAVVAAIAWLTRALHLDGLADTVDALGSGADRERALQIMKAGDVGPMGVVALVLVLAAQSLAAGVLLGSTWGWVVVALLLAAARAGVWLGCVKGVPAARPQGLGAMVAGSVNAFALVIGWLIIAGVLDAAAVLIGRPAWPLLVGVWVAVLIAALLARLMIKRFGGITGDSLGALVETTATALLVVATLGPVVQG